MVLAGDRVVDVVQVLVRIMLDAAAGRLTPVIIDEAPVEENIEDEQEEGQPA